MSEEKKEKSASALLKEKLFASKKQGCLKVSGEELEAADSFCEEYKNFLGKAKIEREAVAYAIEAAKKAGFEEFDRTKTYSAGDRVYVNNRNKAVMLAVIGKKGTTEGVRLGIAHIDSPRLDLKPVPLYEANNLALFKTHYYGGIKKYQWPTVPLALHGAVALKDGTTINVVVGEDESDPCFVVTDLLPHLADEQMTAVMRKAFNGEHLNVLVGSRPFNAAGASVWSAERDGYTGKEGYHNENCCCRSGQNGDGDRAAIVQRGTRSYADRPKTGPA